MIKSITFENFFSFGPPQKVELNADTNILIGINGSGKSNFLKGIEFLYEAVCGIGIEKLFLQRWGGFDSVSNFAAPDKDKITLTYEFDISREQYIKNDWLLGFTRLIPYQSFFYKIIIRRIGTVNYGIYEALYQDIIEEKDNTAYRKYYIKRDIIDLFYNERGFQKEDIKDIVKDFRSEAELAVRSVAGVLFNDIREYLQKMSTYEHFNTTAKSPIRELASHYSDKVLLSDGINLASILSNLNVNDIDAFDLIQEQLRKVNPNFKDLAFSTPMAGKTLLSLKEVGMKRAIGIDQISDGTLHFLLLLAIFYNPNSKGLVCLDEPENGLHPDMIRTLAKAIKYAASKGTQVIIATHSPLLLNDFELEDLMIFEKDDANQTVVKRKTEEDFEHWQDSFLLGQLWLNGQLGGTRW